MTTATEQYSAQPSGGENDWWYVANSHGYNCLSFREKPGAKFTTEAHARRIAEDWNENGYSVVPVAPDAAL